MMSPLLMFQQQTLTMLFRLLFLDRLGGFWFDVALFDGVFFRLGKKAGSKVAGWPRVVVGTAFASQVG